MIYLQIVNSVDFLTMQQALDALQSWASTWQLTISVKKCCILNIGSRPTVHSPSLSLVNTVLPIKSSVLDLGININVNLSPSERVCCIVARAHKRALAIRRCFTSRDTRLLLRAYVYITYVRPFLEHNSVIWSPATKHDIDEIERVQKNVH